MRRWIQYLYKIEIEWVGWRISYIQFVSNLWQFNIWTICWNGLLHDLIYFILKKWCIHCICTMVAVWIGEKYLTRISGVDLIRYMFQILSFLNFLKNWTITYLVLYLIIVLLIILISLLISIGI